MKRIVLLFITVAVCLLAQSGMKITVEPKADLKSDVDVPLEITVKDAKGAPVSGAQVEVVATMVDMDHGEFKSTAKQAKPGVYEAKQKFMMGGNWNLAVKATKGSDTASVNKRVEVKE
jgi:nitrogen fixation protein FixH